MAAFSAALVNTTAGPVWCHCSRLVKTIRLRRFLDGSGYLFEIDDETEIVEEICLADLKEWYGRLTGSTPKHWDVGKVRLWEDVLARLSETGGVPADVRDKSDRDDSAMIFVPLTPLRKFYAALQTFDAAMFEAIADGCRDRVEALESLWKRSRRKFAKCDNPADWEHGKRKPLDQIGAPLSQVTSTHEFVCWLARDQRGGLDIEGESFQFIDYELSPWNTRGGRTKDGKPATSTGRGGIDVLLRRGEGPAAVPVVGEVKIDRDKNAFFALVQAMTYAVEMSTENQLRRLKNARGADFGEIDPDNANVEIAILLINKGRDETLEPVRELAAAINRKLEKSQRAFPRLGRIRLIENRGDQLRDLLGG